MTVTNPVAADTSLKNIVKLVKAASAAYGSAQTKVQTAGLAIIVHAETYGDCSQAKALCRAVPARERNSLIGWFSMFSPIGVQMGKTAKEDVCRFIKPESKNFNAFNIEGAKANNWFDDPADANPEPKSLNTLADFWSTVDALLAKAIKDADKTGDKAKFDENDRETVKSNATAVRALVNSYRVKAAAASAASTPAPAAAPAGDAAIAMANAA